MSRSDEDELRRRVGRRGVVHYSGPILGIEVGEKLNVQGPCKVITIDGIVEVPEGQAAVVSLDEDGYAFIVRRAPGDAA